MECYQTVFRLAKNERFCKCSPIWTVHDHRFGYIIYLTEDQKLKYISHTRFFRVTIIHSAEAYPH